MVQKRKTSTKEDIKEALIQLLSEERFDTISISKLCKRAGINRGTFYLHYQDKYQMVESLKKEIISQLSSCLLYTSSKWSDLKGNWINHASPHSG